MKELEKRLDNEMKKNKKNEDNLRQKEENLAAANNVRTWLMFCNLA